MIFNDHSRLAGEHSFLSASRKSWVNYTDEKLLETYRNHKEAQYGTRLHALAEELITLGIHLPRSRKTLNLYVNEAINYRMQPEQVLYYSANCFGTADAISFRKGLLRIHDLKTGKIKASMTQLEIYAAMFCLEYNKTPAEIEMELRIYQNDDVDVCVPDPQVIEDIMLRIVHFDKLIEQAKAEGI